RRARRRELSDGPDGRDRLQRDAPLLPGIHGHRDQQPHRGGRGTRGATRLRRRGSGRDDRRRLLTGDIETAREKIIGRGPRGSVGCIWTQVAVLAFARPTHGIGADPAWKNRLTSRRPTESPTVDPLVTSHVRITYLLQCRLAWRGVLLRRSRPTGRSFLFVPC